MNEVVRDTMHSRHQKLLMDRWKRTRILVVGDVGIDVWITGDVERISPEAPVPVLRHEKTTKSLAMAGNVYRMVSALGARCTLATVCGTASGARDLGVPDLISVNDPCRSMTTKTRAMGRVPGNHQPHQILRIDQETTTPVPDRYTSRLLSEIRRSLVDYSAVLISDYGKGVCTSTLCSMLIDLCSEQGKICLVDPAIGANWEKYRGATAIKANEAEAAGNTLPSPFCEMTIVTHGANGCELYAPKFLRSSQVFGAIPRHVSDATGCGDQFLAVLGLAVAAGAEWDLACEVANLAAGKQAEKVGCVPITYDEFWQEIDRRLAA